MNVHWLLYHTHVWWKSWGNPKGKLSEINVIKLSMVNAFMNLCYSLKHKTSNSEMKIIIITSYRRITRFSFWCSKSNAIKAYLKKKKKERKKKEWQQGCYHYVVKVFQKGDSRVTEVLQKGDSKKTADNTDEKFFSLMIWVAKIHMKKFISKQCFRESRFKNPGPSEVLFIYMPNDTTIVLDAEKQYGKIPIME